LVSRDRIVIDGHYRLEAARLLGLRDIDCEYFDGTTDAAYLEALRRNVTHGLPLTLRERKRAARRLLGEHMDWSDRRIGELCGLSHGTIANLRASVVTQADQPGTVDRRVGKDNKLRPVNPGGARDCAARELCADPGASLREIARRAGTTHETVRSVRSQLLLDADGSKRTLRLAPSISPLPQATAHHPDPMADPAFTATPDGSMFAEWFNRTAVAGSLSDLVLAVPLSRVYEIADESQRRANFWSEFCSALSKRVSRGARLEAVN
jgi:ParB-like chromosome segregation protein Spo0J